MALLDNTSFFSNSFFATTWANGKYGAIIPYENCRYIFVEFGIDNDNCRRKYLPSEYDEKCPVLAYGFVYYWLRYRKHNSVIVGWQKPENGGKTPKEIYDLYIEARKKWFLEYMNNRPDAWKYPDLEKMFFEKNLTKAGEAELILKSEPLLEYLDEEDKAEFEDVMKNFLDYVANIVEPYQHVLEKEKEKKVASSKPQKPQDSDDQNNNAKMTIPEKYLKSVESVFMKTYRLYSQNYPVYLNVHNIGKRFLAPDKPTLVPIFIEACCKMKMARDISLLYPKDIVDALIGLGALQLRDSDIKKFSDSVGRKIKRMKNTELTSKEQECYDSIKTALSKPSTE